MPLSKCAAGLTGGFILALLTAASTLISLARTRGAGTRFLRGAGLEISVAVLVLLSWLSWRVWYVVELEVEGRGDVGVVMVEVDIERLIQVVNLDIDFVGVSGAGGVMGFEHSAIVLLREGGSRVRPVVRRLRGALGSALLHFTGAEKTEPMSDSVSERTCMRMEGAM
jgi:hypothetical protein